MDPALFAGLLLVIQQLKWTGKWCITDVLNAKNVRCRLLRVMSKLEISTFTKNASENLPKKNKKFVLIVNRRGSSQISRVEKYVSLVCLYFLFWRKVFFSYPRQGLVCLSWLVGVNQLHKADRSTSRHSKRFIKEGKRKEKKRKNAPLLRRLQ
jgi:hypothetical protein